MFTVIWFDMDHSFHEDERGTLEEARKWARYIEEHGGWGIRIEDENGEEVP